MVQIKEGVVWGKWQLPGSFVPVQTAILDAKSWEELNAAIKPLLTWAPEEPVSAGVKCIVHVFVASSFC